MQFLYAENYKCLKKEIKNLIKWRVYIIIGKLNKVEIQISPNWAGFNVFLIKSQKTVSFEINKLILNSYEDRKELESQNNFEREQI